MFSLEVTARLSQKTSPGYQSHLESEAVGEEITILRFSRPLILDGGNVPQILRELDSMFARSVTTDVLVDLSHLLQMQPSGLLFFLAVREYALMHGRRCVFIHISRLMQETVQTYRIDQLVEIASDAEAGLKRLQSP